MGIRAFAVALVLAQICVAASPAHEARVLARKAKKALKKGDDAQAYILYSEAAALQPGRKFRKKAESLQSSAALQASSLPMGTALPLGDTYDTGEVFDSLTAREFARARQPQPPPELKAKPGRQPIDIAGDAKSLFDQVANRFGLDTVYDGDYPTNGPRIRFQLADADYREALHGLEAATASFVIPLSSRLFMIAKDNPQKRNDLEQAMAVSIPVPQATTTQELTEIVAAVRQVTGVQKLAWDTASNQIVMRDRVSRVIPAQALLQQLLSYRPEISMELEFLEVYDDDLLNYGFTVTNSFPLVYLGKILNSTPNIAAAVNGLLTFGGGKTLIGLGVAQVQAMFNDTQSSARNLLRSQVRSADGQAATFHIGEKYPVLTSGYFGPPSSGTVYTPPPSYTFEDLGISVKITPHVHGMGEITLAVETSFEVLTGNAVNGIPIIGSRKLVSQVRLKNDEWAVVAGLISTGKSKNVSGFWGLENIPLIGNLFRQTSEEKLDQHVLIAIRPRLLAMPADQILTKALRVGSETRPFTPL